MLVAFGENSDCNVRIFYKVASSRDMHAPINKASLMLLKGGKLLV